ncbi:phosphoheptose isomerase [Candidatus Kaiserbacteria bacterium RIFCSPHIGHO2_01_FULL_50_13]|uniref:Phosphoheptose isomerase n=1 Tax=Candidatus Kaiserbacteria bacterium RIFCSPLOWO2_01_FULL_50_24 TaxID=1798507 RepID=A0A1F6EJ19_9BACT|nr:MAG: phosphoheptose isomerase [Candidatus Kaiserbacteria bacterium RIFCSPHIGHO2_01_FULL_50_13]OGG73634.1 MAG: phosphoheptose isomerase [Candidatus Kaiserbacteria bacterium RIFCSPLOWO2_01_FULL_50_24]OGG81293.1 MAG: phosphoheptose isomerase [Candidatus Kaiserbacteria bacterium RIFCSPLOWO2_02_FULL_51_13]
MRNSITSAISSSVAVKERLLRDEKFIGRLLLAIDILIKTFRSDKRVYLCGNGGSAADAQHIAAEFSGKFYLDRKALPAEALHVNTSFLTAVANDYSYANTFKRNIEAFGRKGDVLIGISTSGNSDNIVRAQKEARRRGMMVISMTGKTGGKLAKSCDILLNVPSTDTPRIQESHILLGHIMAECVEQALFGKRKNKKKSK